MGPAASNGGGQERAVENQGASPWRRFSSANTTLSSHAQGGNDVDADENRERYGLSHPDVFRPQAVSP